MIKKAGSRKAGAPGTSDVNKKPALPTRADILAFIGREQPQSPTKIGKREIARAFSITGADRIGLKKILKELEAEGAVERSRKQLHKPGQLPAVVLAEIVKRDADGELIAQPVEWDNAQGPIPKILIHLGRRRPGMAAPGIGDRGLIRTELAREAGPNEPAYTGRVVKLFERAKTQVLGIFRTDPAGGGRVVPIDKRNARAGEFVVAEGGAGEALDGDLVAVDVLRAGRLGLPAVRVRERLGSLATERAMSLIAVHAHKIPNVFGADALAEAARAKPATLSGREDWREIPLITIDPADAKDHDDAVFAHPDHDPENQGGHIICVAIADVAAYVRPGSALDREAFQRGNSVYFPDRVVPMLPERISNDLCSLRPNEDRAALAFRIIIARDGRVLSQKPHRVLMRSAAKLTYAQVQAAWDGLPGQETQALLAPVLKPLFAAYESLKTAREKRAPLDLDLPERKILLKSDGTVDRVVVPPRLEAHRLIEEFMILANVAAAETLEKAHQPLIYRGHGEPTFEKLNALAEFLASVGIKLAKGQVLTPRQFNGILAQVKGTEHENIVSEVVLRTQAQAEYVAENYGHFGLHLRRYAHFTSPIRRYADLIVHRALIRAQHLGSDGLPETDTAQLAEIAAQISATERRAMAAERETVDRLIAQFLSEQIGATFEGRISGVTGAGLFVKLAETGADGFIPITTLGDEYFVYDDSQHALIGRRSGITHRLGDEISVRLVEAAPFAGALRFELVSGGKETGRQGKAKGARAGHRDKRSNGAPAPGRLKKLRKSKI
ncbi:RNAse R [Methylovirgula ligni]|uniref:Ribonuclease R n=1 Tax=Methylovirgula ligni TaxID=569860 RepID=A0A3D9YY44_9HYPH|nr:RNAse R [Methylovirgula ligni]